MSKTHKAVMVGLILIAVTAFVGFTLPKSKTGSASFPPLPAATDLGYAQMSQTIDTGVKASPESPYLVMANGRALPYTEYILDSASRPKSGGVFHAYNVKSHVDSKTGHLLLTITGLNFDSAELPGLKLTYRVF